MIAREPVGARRLGFTAGAVAVHALAAWLVSRPPPARPPTPLTVRLVPPGASFEALRPLEREAGPRARSGPQGPAEQRPATRRREPRPLPSPPSAAIAAIAPPLAASALEDPRPLDASGGAFSGAGGDPYDGRLARHASVETGGRAPAGVIASRWLVLHRRDIVRRIQERASRRPYPPLAAARGWTGLVRVAFTIRTDGTVADLRVVRSSGRRALDECALDDVRAAAPFPRPPEEQAVEVPILYVLV